MDYTERKVFNEGANPSRSDHKDNYHKDGVPNDIKKCLKKLARETYYLWGFIWQEGLHEEAVEFMKEYMDQETPFERIRMDSNCSLEDAMAFFL